MKRSQSLIDLLPSARPAMEVLELGNPTAKKMNAMRSLCAALQDCFGYADTDRSKDAKLSTMIDVRQVQKPAKVSSPRASFCNSPGVSSRFSSQS